MGRRGLRPRALRALARLLAALHDRDLGWLLGHRFLLLTHLGRRTGRRRRTALEVVHRDRATGEVVVLCGFGRTADWYRNIRRTPAVEVVVARERFRPQQRFLGEDEAVAVLADYERRHRWVAPVVRRLLGGLLGRRYDGSAAARRELVRQLPLVAFRPRE